MNRKSAFILLLFAVLVTLIILIILVIHPKGKINEDPFDPESGMYHELQSDPTGITFLQQPSSASFYSAHQNTIQRAFIS